jgi:hypothetical protein
MQTYLFTDIAGSGGNYRVTTGLFAVGGFNLLRGIYYQIRYGSRA